jgi:acyl-CoA synthetase (AMP-forming)/AMP-acid ligase II
VSEAAIRSKPPNFLEINAEKHPDKTAAIGMEQTLTFGQLQKRARALAQGLYDLGVRPGDQVALMTYNLPEYAEVSLTLPYLEVGLVMIGYRMKPPEIEFIVDNSDSRVLIFWHEFADRILPYREKYKKVLPEGFVSFGGPGAAGAVEYESLFNNTPTLDLDNLPPAREAGNAMIYTSGTTGKPKGASRKTDFVNKPGVMDYLFATLSFLKLDDHEVHLVCCPIYHSAPTYFNMVAHCILGGTSVFQPRFDGEQFLRLVDEHKVTSTHLVPTMITRLLQVPETITNSLDLSSLRSVICGAAPLFPEQKLAFLDRFGDCLYEYYGSTETGINTFINPQEMRQRPSSVGKPFADNELKIFDEMGREIPDNERGILYIHNAVMMDGYYKNEKATIETYRGKHITVGDVAIRDQEGFFYIVDRIKDIIIRGGVNIYPAEVEEVLSTMPGIADVAVVGKPDQELGETVAAFVVFEEDVRVTDDDIKEFCGKEMANQKVPATIISVDEIPRTPTGKILKKDLRDMLGG